MGFITKPRSLRKIVSGFLLGLSVLGFSTFAQVAPVTNVVVNQAYIREHYTKYEHMIPMRDGIRLFTAIYAPKDISDAYPILLTRTPYGVRPYSEDAYPDPGGPLQHYAKENFIFAMQDVRGRNGSEGEFVHVRPQKDKKNGKEIDESSDAWDTIDWLVKNVTNNNGKVGMMG